MDKNKAIDKLKTLKQVGENLVNTKRGSQDFKKWRRDTEVAIERIFGEDTRHLKDFQKIRYSLGMFSSSTPESTFERAYQSGMKTSVTTIQSFIDEIEEYWTLDDTSSEKPEDQNSLVLIQTLISRFHQVARQLRSRHANRPTLDIDDEYDVQDLFHALLRIHFDDVRPEECTPSYAGAASRVDFLLKKERIVIEIKKTRKSLKAKELGEQLIIDTQRYQAHPDCDVLVCFVYDPEGQIANPKGIENDLSRTFDGLPVEVYITPQQ